MPIYQPEPRDKRKNWESTSFCAHVAQSLITVQNMMQKINK